ncbi:TPA: hypothetical protein ACX3CS_003602 [Vibrio parahaemolyticus]
MPEDFIPSAVKSAMSASIYSRDLSDFKAVSGAMSTYEKTITDAANNLLEKNLTTESEGYISAISNSFLSVLPEPSQCMNLSIPTINGNQVSIDCQFSEKLKMIISILSLLKSC